MVQKNGPKAKTGCLSYDLLIFDPGPITHFYPKKAQIEQKVTKRI